MSFGQYDFTVLPLGLKNAPGIFMILMNGVFTSTWISSSKYSWTIFDLLSNDGGA
jgi:hypothetical protein